MDRSTDPATIATRSRAPIVSASLPDFMRENSAVAVIEFAFIAPLLILLLLGGFEMTRYARATRQLTYVANSIAEIISQNTSGSVTDTDLAFFSDSTMITYPDVLPNAYAAGKNWNNDISITMSSIVFNPTVKGCTSGCTYNANVVWSQGPFPRPCWTPLSSTADSAPPSPQTLPADTFGPGSMIVVDIVYNYRPVVASSLFSTLRIARSFYIQPRYVSLVNYSGSQPGISCPSSSYQS